MHPAPRPSSTAGLSSQATLLLALTGAGLAVFFVFVLPRLGASRAAAPRSLPPEVRREPQLQPEPVQLAQPMSFEPEAVAQVEIEAPASATVAPGQGTALEEEAKMEGPPLRHLKAGGGKRDTLAHENLQAENRERRKARRERAAAGEEEFVRDGRSGETESPKPFSNPDRKRISKRGGTGRGQGQGKGKPKGG